LEHFWLSGGAWHPRSTKKHPKINFGQVVTKLYEKGKPVLRPGNYKGKLIVVEGIDGSGKSTQIDLLHKWLQSQGKSVYFTEWNSSNLVKSTTRLGKDEKMFTPTTFSLLQATDFCDRWENYMLPMLRAGVIVLADRYAFTAFARDVARGVDRDWVRNLYSFATQPDLVLYFGVPLDIAVERITGARAKIKYYEAGMDLGLSENKVTSFRLFQQRILNEYDNMASEFNFTLVDGSLPVETLQKQVRLTVTKILRGWNGLPNPLSPLRQRAPAKIPAKIVVDGGEK
jgi:dTMP kinase